MIIVKCTDNGSLNWTVYHRSTGATNYQYLNLTQATNAATDEWNDTAPTSSVFTVGTNTDVNWSGHSYVAYLFAHDPDTTNGIIQCGSFTTSGSAGATITLGWEPQYLLWKRTDSTSGWAIYDTARGWNSSSTNWVYANSSNEEFNNGFTGGMTGTGFIIDSSDVISVASASYIYMAIRKGPM